MINLWLHRLIQWFAIGCVFAFTHTLYTVNNLETSEVIWFTIATALSYWIAYGMSDHINEIKFRLQGPRPTVRKCPECGTIEGVSLEASNPWRCPRCLILFSFDA